MEDIDAAFFQGVSREESAGTSSASYSSPINRPRQGSGKRQVASGGDGITLAGLLNAIDGVTAQEGRILFATTNKYDALDPALVRPGRLDVHVQFGMASRWQAQELFKCFFPPNETASATENANKEDVINSSLGKKKDQSALSTTVSTSDRAQSQIKYLSSRATNSCPNLTSAEVDRLAATFSAKIPERVLSMASIQGYLMRFKGKPWAAVQNLEAWVLEEQEKAEARRLAEIENTNEKYTCMKRCIWQQRDVHTEISNNLMNVCFLMRDKKGCVTLGTSSMVVHCDRMIQHDMQ